MSRTHEEWRAAAAALEFDGRPVIGGVRVAARSGATIVGAMLMRVEKRAAAEFSFFLAMPTMAGATALDAWKSRNEIDMSHAGIIAFGFVVSFVVGYIVVRQMLDFVTRHGFAPFAWWRIAVGVAGLAGLMALGH